VRLERAPKTASTPLQPFFQKLSNTGQQFIPDWPIISVEFKSSLDGSGAYLSLLAWPQLNLQQALEITKYATTRLTARIANARSEHSGRAAESRDD